MKLFFKIVFGLLAIVILAVAAFLFTFDANNYKTQITELVEQQTGRTLSIDGDISVSLFPWVGFAVGKLSLSNAEGFSDNPFASIDQLDLKIKLLPLLKREVEIDRIRLHGLYASLETHKDGKTNWDDLAQPKPAEAETAAPAAANADATSATGAPALAGLLVNGIEFVGAKVQWLDAKSGMRAAVSDLNLETGAIQFGQWVPLTFSAHVTSNQPEVDAGIKLETKLKFNTALNVFDLDNLALNIDTLMRSVSAERIQLALKTSAHADLQQHRASLSKLTLSAFGAELMADLVADIGDQPSVKGTLSSNEINPKALAARFGIALPESANPSRLGKLVLNTVIDASPTRAKLSDIKIQLDDSTLSGTVEVPDIAAQRVRYQLKLDSIDVDSYLPPVVETAEPAVPVAPAPEQDIEIALPVELMRTLDIAGEFDIGALRVKAIDVTDVHLVTKADKGVITLAPISMKTLKGSIDAEAAVDVRQASQYRFKLDAANLVPESVVNPLLVGMLGDQETEIQGGTAALKVDVKTSGQWLSELKRSATGNLRLDISKTVLAGADIVYFVRNSVANYLTEKSIDVSSDWRGVYKPKEKTAFDSILVTGLLSGGQLVNDKLAVDSSRIKVKGDGIVDIMKNSIDEKLEVVLNMERQESMGDKVLAQPVPVHIHGPFSQLAFDVDKSRLAKTVAAIIKVEAGKKAAEVKAAADAKAAAAKAEAQQKLDAKKQALKAKEEAKKEEQKQQMEDKLKNKLKGLFN